MLTRDRIDEAKMDWRKVIADYAKQGWGITKIAQATGLSPTKVRQFMGKAGKVDPKKPAADKDAYLRKTFPEMYREEVQGIAEALGNIRPVSEAKTVKDAKGEVLAVGDTVRDKLGDVRGVGVIKAIEPQPGARGPLTIQWRTKGSGSGWFGRDLVLVKKAAKEHRALPFDQLDALLAVGSTTRHDTNYQAFEGKPPEALPVDELDNLLTQTPGVPGAVASEMRGSIGPGGIEASKNIHLMAPGRYYMGASSSPTMVIVTSVGPESITYYDPYNGSKRTMQRWIAEDLIAKGTATWLKTYGKYHPKVAAELKKALAGKPHKKTKLKDWDRITVHVQAKSGDPSGVQVWRAAERYGSVGGMTQKDGTEVLEIRGFRNQVEGAKQDPNLTNYKEVKVDQKAG